MNKNNFTTRKIVFAAILTALSAVLTMFPSFKTLFGGYVHFGDSVIYITAILFDPVTAAIVGGIGHSIADLILAPIFIVPTLIIKSTVGYTVSKIAQGNIKGVRIYLALLCGLVIITSGYFLFYIILGNYAGAIDSLISSPVQWGMSIIATAILLPIVIKLSNKA